MVRYLPPLKAGAELGSLGTDEVEMVFGHSVHLSLCEHIAELIDELRQCESAEDYRELQRRLAGALFKIEMRRSECSRMIKRLVRGESVPVDAPLPPTGGSVNDCSAWRFENFMYERMSRQLRSVGDAMAWQLFGFDRRVILVLSRNASPGLMYGKAGLEYELGKVDELWADNGTFALLHGVTNCLRIADLSEFTSDRVVLHEVKKKRSRGGQQRARAEAAVEALMRGGLLPGEETQGTRLLQLNEPYRTDVSRLPDLCRLAAQRGSAGIKLSARRAIIGTRLITAHDLWADDDESGRRVMESIRSRALRRARMDASTHHIRGYSCDTAARSEIMAPYAIYPLPTMACAEIICDYSIIETVISIEGLTGALDHLGLRSESLLPQAHGELTGAQPVLRAELGGKGATFHANGLDRLLHELLLPATWAGGVEEMLMSTALPSAPAVVYRDEAAVWQASRGVR